jgi:hypothetical protein
MLGGVSETLTMFVLIDKENEIMFLLGRASRLFFFVSSPFIKDSLLTPRPFRSFQGAQALMKTWRK